MSIGKAKAAFKDGQKIKYLGNRLHSTIIEGKEVPVLANGMVYTVIETKPPQKGLGFIKNDEDGEPIIDEDCNGYNVIKNEFGYTRLLWPDNKKEWELLP